jgi:lysophospholipid acyltransferase (LPLAT)-like uncharacterized protein
MIKRFKKILIELKWNLIGIVGKFVIDVIFFTTKIEVVGFEKVKKVIDSRQVILAFWHSRILLISYIYKKENAVIMVSSSGDGEIIARIIQRQGHETVRGSTSRKGKRALIRLIKTIVKENRPGVVIPDGPLGPRFKAQPGIITLAKMTGYTIVPVSYSAKRMAIFSSWDRFILPYPFTTCRVIYDDPIYVPSTADKEEEKVLLMKFEKSLNHITKTVDTHFNHTID